MIAVKVFMKVTKEPLKRTPVVLALDAAEGPSDAVLTDRSGVARFELPPGSGKVLVSGVERFHGRLAGEIEIGLWSITQSGNASAGAPDRLPGGSNAYPSMTVQSTLVEGREILTDSEGYMVDPSEWSEGFARAQAEMEGLALTAEHWELIQVSPRYVVLLAQPWNRLVIVR